MKIPKLNSFQFDSRLQSPIPAFVAGWGGQLATSLLGGLGSLISGHSQAKAQREANATNLAIANQTNATNKFIAEEANKWSRIMQNENNQFNRDMALEMFEKENAYNDPREQVKRMIGAGVNPYASGNGMIAQSTGDISTPTAASVPSPAVASMQAATVQPEPSLWTGFFQNIRDFAQVFDTLSSAGLKDSERNRIETLLKPELEKMIADKENQEANTAFTKVDEQLKQLELAVGKKTKLRKAIEDIRFVHNQAALAKYKGETEKAQKLFIEAQEKLANQEHVFKESYNPEIIKNLQEERELTIQKQKTEKTQQQVNSASAENTRQQTEHQKIVNKYADRLEASIVAGNRGQLISTLRQAFRSGHGLYDGIKDFVGTIRENLGLGTEYGTINNIEELADALIKDASNFDEDKK